MVIVTKYKYAKSRENDLKQISLLLLLYVTIMAITIAENHYYIKKWNERT